MGKQLNRHAHNDRDHRNGQYRKSNPCDACGKPVWTAYYTDEEVCGNTDGPGFFLCDRAKCHKKRDFPLEVRRALYTAQRAINDTAERSPAPETHEDRKRAKFKRAEFEAKRAALRATNVKSSESVTPCDSCDGSRFRGPFGDDPCPCEGAEIPDSGCAECGNRFWSADGHPTLALCRECWQPDAGIRCLEERISKAAAVIVGRGMTDGAHHKQWCLDQVLRILLTDEQYADLVARMSAHPDCASWDVGIAP